MSYSLGINGLDLNPDFNNEIKCCGHPEVKGDGCPKIENKDSVCVEIRPDGSERVLEKVVVDFGDCVSCG